MQPILVAYATVEGQSRKIAEFIAERLRIRGHRVDLVDTASPAAAQVQPIYQAAFLGGSVHYERHPASLAHFIKANLAWLKVVPTAFFSVGLDTVQPHADERDKAKDLVRAFLQEAGIAPVKLRHVAGALKYTQYDFMKRLLARTFAPRLGGADATGQDHEYTDWLDLESFVDEFLAAAGIPGGAVPGRLDAPMAPRAANPPGQGNGPVSRA
jgi:menaquinone-dependent protoporphyrinogen oxidase